MYNIMAMVELLRTFDRYRYIHDYYKKIATKYQFCDSKELIISLILFTSDVGISII